MEVYHKRVNMTGIHPLFRIMKVKSMGLGKNYYLKIVQELNFDFKVNLIELSWRRNF